MSNKAVLILLQAVGALTILPYPFVLLANIMSMAATGQTKLGALPFILLSFYPIVWIILYVVSWRALSHGSRGLAFGLSSVPVVVAMAVAGFFAYGSTQSGKFNEQSAANDRNKIEPLNPLLWAIWSSAGDRRFPPIPSITVERALQAIDANPTLVNLPIPPYGTPLKVAVMNVAINFDGSLIGDQRRQEDLLHVVRALVAHGAQLGAGENTELNYRWRLRRAMHEGPITTASENPLVWRILTRKRDGVTLFSLHKDDIPLLNVSTELHGTPLYAALVEDGRDAYEELINAGARLSREEERDVAASKALSLAFGMVPGLQRTYATAPRSF